MIFKKHEHTTMNKNNNQASNNYKGCSPLQLSCNLAGMKPEIGSILIRNVVPHYMKLLSLTI